ncbi:MAG TPA: GDP-L-fucose synthase [Candidatus Binatia bacterium]|jgi:GDP-L-fucose synthase|nr:GDP-L-fucose synthase [Candidatus Binatia bacterium]
MNKNATIFVADTDGLVGRAIQVELKRAGYEHVLPVSQGAPNLTEGAEVDDYFTQHRPRYVFLIGGKTGGIKANQNYPADLMRDNLLVNCHVIESARRHDVEKLLYLASSCVYPKFSDQPMKVEYLTTGRLEPTNESYALAKLAGLFLCQAYRRQFETHFITAIPANVFGPGDNFSLEDSHVIGALIRKMHEAKTLGQPCVEVWGSGLPRREFIFSHDLADACMFLMDRYDGEEPINLGVGCDWSIREIADAVREVVQYAGELKFDRSKPDGMPAKLLDSSCLKQMGWRSQTSIREALRVTYEWFLEQGSVAGGERHGRALI